MRIVFFGTPPFAARTLEKLLENGHEVVAIVSRPDRPKGRRQRIMPTAVKQVAVKFSNIPFHQPEKVSTEEFTKILYEYQADLFVVVAFGEILRQFILDIPKLACINIHASLLPKYRGAAPIQSAVIHGEKETGISIIHMVKKMDAGNVIAMEKIPIDPEESFGELQDRLCDLGSALLFTVIDRFMKEGRVEGTAQNHELATFSPKIESKDCRVNWKLPAKELHNLIRGVNPYPGAFAEVIVKETLQRIKIFRTKIVAKEHDAPLVIPCGTDALQILELQPPGKKVMKAEDFLRGVQEESLEFLRE